MVEGDLLKFLDKRFKGDIFYTTIFPGKPVGGLTLSRETIPLDWTPIPNTTLAIALLEIGVLTPHTSIDWRVKVNGINVTKEFKPIATAPLGDKLYAKHVFDITSILKLPESMKKNRVNVTFKREGGDIITIEHISLITLFESEEAESVIKYYSGASSLEPGEKIKYGIGYDDKSAVFRTTFYIPSTLAQMLIRIGEDYSVEIRNIQGMNEETHRLSLSNGINDVEYYHIDTGEKYAPKEISLSNILVYNTKYVQPDIVIEEINLPSEAEKEAIAKIRIVNKGESKPDKLLVTVMTRGEVLKVKEIEPLEPGREAEVEIPIKQPPGEYTLIFRVIWKKLTQTWFKEERREIVIK